MSEGNQEGKMLIPLDGTYGVGPTCEITIITRLSKDSNQLREVTYEVPYWIVNTQRLQMFADMNFIAGYRLVRNNEAAPALKDLGLS